MREREDESHVLKVTLNDVQLTGNDNNPACIAVFREFGVSQLQVKRYYVEAFKSCDHGLTYLALTCRQKHSVEDAERLFLSSKQKKSPFKLPRSEQSMPASLSYGRAMLTA